MVSANKERKELIMTVIINPTPTEPAPGGLATRDLSTAHKSATVQTVSIVIPAFNEVENIHKVIANIPHDELSQAGCEVEVIVVDNASTDGTGEVAAAHGATVVVQPMRGYGNAYHAGFAAARGRVIATGDADCTYPFDVLPELVDHLVSKGLDFLSTNRLGRDNRPAMKGSHWVGNRLLTVVSRSLFRSPFHDSQSGMWIFRSEVWRHVDVRSGGMSFSQEIKNEAYLKGFSCGEVGIEYRPRGGEVKLNAFRDGIRNASQLVSHRLRGRRRPAPTMVAYKRVDQSSHGKIEAPCGVVVA
jgi:glycosyltransferase involved in cell wall biosynthesis